ncbi:hypothetical protein ACES2L_10045 [Bdellovibrio bacteriovorus]
MEHQRGRIVNIAQHLVLSILLSFGSQALAQEKAEDKAAKTAAEATQEEVPAPQRSLLKTAATKNFSKPLYFDQLDNGVILPPMELEYDLSDGKNLKIGNVTLNEKNFFFALLPLGKTHSQINQVLSSSEAGKVALIMSWPQALMSHGTVEMISRTGTVLWTYSFTKEDQANWAKQLEDWRKSLVGKGVPAKALRGGIFASQYAITDVESVKAPFWGQKEAFRFCVTQTTGNNSTKICSQRYGAKSSGKNVVMGKMRQDPVTPRVLVQNEEAKPKASVPVAADMPTSFFAELATGESYEFVTLPHKVELMDIADTKKADTLRIVGYDTRPIGRSIILNPDQYSKLTKLLGFEATIGDPRKFWAMALKKDDPKIYLPGQGGGVFKQRFELNEIPRSQNRVYLHAQTPTGTYIDGVKLFGRKQPVAEVSSDQNSVDLNPQDPAVFTWNFKATERGKINRSYLNVTADGKTYKSYYEMYKGYPREISGRFSGVQAAGKLIIMGEVAYNQWFEDLFGWQNYWLSRQRWGASFKYFQSFNKMDVSATETAGISVMTLDLKWRYTPGLWGRDETVGGMFSYQNVTFGKAVAPMVGAGAFWARSMPKVFDDLFNLIPLMRYPKWVDMEFIYYAVPMSSNVTLNAPMSLNFHGKVLWSERIFGEAGFGMKRYGFTDSSVNQRAELNTFYGTVGLGINF